MNRDFIRDFFQKIHKILPELEYNINRDDIPNVKNKLLDLELEFVIFKRKLIKEYRKEREF